MNVFDLFARIKLDSSDYRIGLSEAGATAVAFAKATGEQFAKVGKAFVDLGKMSLNAYSSYEQLVGGVDTLFKDSSQKVQEYAANAYKTSGLSANQYMETVTSFSASLLQSLGNDTEKAADYANTAIIDMSDNANKMGSDLISISTAYQGFAKQNYTMLDNLKLGYGGTKSEMERLLQDAEKLSGVAYSIDRYGDIVQAIHVIQQEIGITGTTAEEAADTIEGSTKSMQAAWQNLVTELGKSNGNGKKYLDNFIDTFQANISNIAPRIGQIARGIGELIKEAAPILAEELTPILGEVLPVVFESIPTIVDSLGNVLPKLAPTLVHIGTSIISSIWQGIMSRDNDSESSSFIEEFEKELSTKLPYIKRVGENIIKQILKGISENTGNLLESASPIVEKLVSGITEKAPGIGAAVIPLLSELGNEITNPENFSKFLESASGIISGLISGLTSKESMDKLFGDDGIPKVIANLIEDIDNLAESFLNLATALISGIIRYFADPSNKETIDNGATTILVALGEAFVNLVSCIHKNITDLLSDIAVDMVGEFDADATALEMLGKLGKALLKKFWESTLPGMIGKVISNVDELFRKEAWLENPYATGTWEEYENGDVLGSRDPQRARMQYGISSSQMSDEALIRWMDSGAAVSPLEWLENDYAERARNYAEVHSVQGIPVFGSGGIVTKPTIAMIGEEGAEAVVPLERESEVGRMFGGVTIQFGNIYVNGGIDAGNEVVRQIDEALRIWQVQHARGIGGTAWQT